MATLSAVERLLVESEEDDLDNVDLSGITLEEILREEEAAAQDAHAIVPTLLRGESEDDDDAFFSPAATLAVPVIPGMDVVPAKAPASQGDNGRRKQSLTEIAVGGYAALAAAANGNGNVNGADGEKEDGERKVRSPLEVAEAREKRLLSSVGVELVSPLQVKRRMRAQGKRSVRPPAAKVSTVGNKNVRFPGGKKLETKSTGVVKVQALDVISRQLQKNIEFKDHGPGSPTVVAIHSKFIAIGTSKGLVLIFDHFQNILQVLGNTVESDGDGPVTAVDVSPGSDFLVCGYQSGRVVLWDMIKGTSLKAVSDAHDCPVVSLCFIKDQKSVLLSVDTNGIVNKITFSKPLMMMGMIYNCDVDPIYDGSAGKILSISVLPQSAGNAKISHITDQYVLAALSSERLTFIVAIEPEVKVLFRWPRPATIEADAPVIPSLSFSWITFPGSARALAPVLARGWGKGVQFLEVVFPGGEAHTHSKHGWPTFDEHDPIACQHDIMAVQWLGDQVVVYLNSHDEICVYDVMSRQELEVVDVSSLELVFASYRGKNARSFSNSFRGCDRILYLLGLKELQTAQVQPWTQRIDTLVDDGQWLEALALALDHYEGLQVAAADRAVRDRFPPVFFRNAHNDQCLVDLLHMSQTNQRTGEKEDVFRHEDSADEVRWCCGEDAYPPEISKKLEETYQQARSGLVTKNFVPISVVERVSDLLMEYVRLAIANAPDAAPASSLGVARPSSLKLDLSRSHYQMLAGVCIEYCSIINRTDILFGEIFKRFKDAGKDDVFVELLEPYILSDRLRNLSPEVLHAFVAHYDASNKLPQVEQCLLHLNVRELDLDSMVKLCEQHELYSALIYILNEGQQDYIKPIDILLEAASKAPPPPPSPEPSPAASQSTVRQTSNRISGLAAAFGGTNRTASSTSAPRPPKPLEKAKSSNVLSAEKRRHLYGYKLLLYLLYTLKGRSFPKDEPLSPQVAARVRADVLEHLFEKGDSDSTTPYERLHELIGMDAKEFLNILALVLDDPTIEFEGEKNEDGGRPTSRYDTARKAGVAKCPSRLSMVLALAEVILGPNEDLTKSKFTSVEHGHFYMFEARLLSGGGIDPQEYAKARSQTQGTESDIGSMMNSLMNFLAVGPSSLRPTGAAANGAVQEEGFDKAGREAMLVRMLQKLNKDFYDQRALLQSVSNEKMNRAAVILHKENGDISNAIASYLADEDAEFRLNAFSYIRVEMERAAVEDGGDVSGDQSTTTGRLRRVEDAVLTHAGALMEADGHAFVLLIIGQLPHLNNRVIQKFISLGKQGAKLEFLYLKQILSNSGSSSDVNDEADELRELLERSRLRLGDDPAVQERFVRLLCEFEPAGVFPYLETHDSYKVDACLKLCQDFGITDAEAYLLERTGDVTGALTLLLKSLEQKLKVLKPALRGHNVTADSRGGGAGSGPSASATDSIVESLPEGRDAKQTLEVALTMCQRNSLRNRDNQAEKLWFTLLEKLLRIQNAVKRALTSGKSSSARIAMRNGGAGGSQTAFQVALNELIRMTLERMSSSVSLKAILFKITSSENGRGEFGDFRPTIFGMLDTYNYEQNIYQTANGLISVDLYEQIVTLRRALSRAYAPPSSTCHYCKVSLSKPPFGMAHSGSEKWNLSVSMVMVVSGKTFHESCAKAWQQSTETNARKRPPLQHSASSDNLGSSTTNLDGAASDDDTSTRLQKKQPSTRRYLTRLRNARKHARRQVSLHVVLESLVAEKNERNKYLRSSRTAFSLRPDPEQASKVKKRIGTRQAGALPVEPIQKGSILG